MQGGNMAAAFIAMNVRAGGINFSIASACASAGHAIGEAAESSEEGRKGNTHGRCRSLHHSAHDRYVQPD